MTTPHLQLPEGITVFERGWLSSNNILIAGPERTALVDSGYATHSVQTLALVSAALQGRPLDVLVNTHLHSDHCGGNAALQACYSGLRTLIPPGHAAYVAAWDAYALSYTPTGQRCEPFSFSATLQPGSELDLGGQTWQIHAAPGHDPNSVMLFEPSSRTLISADALWGNGFGVVFPELDGANAFLEVEQTLDLIESLQPRVVVPGHGPVFSDVIDALARARKRLASFVNDPAKHLHYAAKVLIKFKLLEVQRMDWQALLAWANATDIVGHVHRSDSPGTSFDAWVDQLVTELMRGGAAKRVQQTILNVN
jgi:glyoxylase-like metal-dependent hydrolase (beta-lactamase superfamily II)